MIFSSAEQKKIQEVVAAAKLEQKKARLGCPAQFKIPGQKGTLKSPAVVVTEQFVLFLDVSSKQVKLIEHIHVYEIKAIQLVGANGVALVLEKGTIEVAFDQRDRFLQDVNKGCHFFSFSLPPEERYRLEIEEDKRQALPPLKPASRFQIGYHAFCTYFRRDSKEGKGSPDRCRHCPELADYYYAQMAYGCFSFDYADAQPLGGKLFPHFDWEPVFAALRYSQFSPIISVEHVNSPTVVTHVAKLVQEGHYLQVISLVSVGATVGAEVFGRALTFEKRPIRFIDLSGNKFRDIAEFARLLEKFSTDLLGLVLNDMHLEEPVVTQLFTSLVNNDKLHGLRELSLLHTKISAKNCRLVTTWLEKLGTTGRAVPHGVLALGPVADVASIVETIKKTKLCFFTLRFIDSDIGEAADGIAVLIAGGEHLRVLDFSGSTVKDVGFQGLMTAVGASQGGRPISLNLSNMFGKGGAKTSLLLDGLEKAKNRISELYLDGNALSSAEVSRLAQILAESSNLKKLSISGLKCNDFRGLHQLLTMIKLEGLSMTNMGSLEKKVLALVTTQFKAGALKRLDISHNKITDEDIQSIVRMVGDSEKFECIIIDDVGLKSLDTLKTFLTTCTKSRTLIQVPFPQADFMALKAKVKPPKSKGKAGEKDPLKGVYEKVGQLNTRLGINRFVRPVKVPTPLIFRGDAVLVGIIQEITNATKPIYKSGDDQFERSLRVESSFWNPQKYMGLSPCLSRVKIFEADERVPNMRRRFWLPRGKVVKIGNVLAASNSSDASDAGSGAPGKTDDESDSRHPPATPPSPTRTTPTPVRQPAQPTAPQVARQVPPPTAPEVARPTAPEVARQVPPPTAPHVSRQAAPQAPRFSKPTNVAFPPPLSAVPEGLETDLSFMVTWPLPVPSGNDLIEQVPASSMPKKMIQVQPGR
jgi:Leucine-rich repeat (LRR) protein